MTKEEKIKEAYGEYLDRFNPSLLDGWSTTCFSENIDKDIFDEEDTGYFGYLRLRPKSLQGIENNNGWTKIETKEDLPKLGGEYDVVIRGKMGRATYLRNDRWLVDENDYPKTTSIHLITHYQEKIRRELPLY